jgi:O-antigen/teichoic acid export membrane protein
MSTVGRKLALGSSLNSLYLVATALISVLIMPFVVHSLGDRLYGIWALAAAVISYYNVLELGLSSAVGRFVAGALGSGDKQQLNRVYNTSLLVFTLIGLTALVISVAAAPASTLFIKNPLDAPIFWRAILILGASLAIGFPMRVLKGVLEADLRFGPSAGIDLLGLLLRTALLIVFIKMGAKVVGLAWATLLANLPALILYPYFVRRNLPALHFSRSFWTLSTSKDLFSCSIISFIAQAGGLLRNFSPFIVASFLGNCPAHLCVSRFRAPLRRVFLDCSGNHGESYVGLCHSVSIDTKICRTQLFGTDYVGSYNGDPLRVTLGGHRV